MARRRPRRFSRRVKAALRPVRRVFVRGVYRFGLWTFPRLSHAWALRIGRAFGRIVHRLAVRDRERGLSHLDIAFGEELSRFEKRRVIREAFESLGMMAAETLHAMGWKKKDYLRAIEFDGVEHLEAARSRGKGIVFATAHFGNWELMPPAMFFYSDIATGVIMRDMRDAALTRYVREMRGRCGNPIFSTQDSALGYIRLLRRGGAIAMLPDHASERLSGMDIEYFGRPAWTPAGPAFLARKTGASILPVFLIREESEPMRHVFRIHPPVIPDPDAAEEEDVRRMLQEYTQRLEDEVRANPGQWMWMHERWERRPEPTGPRGKKNAEAVSTQKI